MRACVCVSASLECLECACCCTRFYFHHTKSWVEARKEQVALLQAWLTFLSKRSLAVNFFAQRLSLDPGTPSSVAIRVPDHAPLALLMDMAGPIALTSANPSGEPDSTHHEVVLQRLGEGAPHAHLCARIQAQISRTLTQTRIHRVTHGCNATPKHAHTYAHELTTHTHNLFQSRTH